MRKEERSIQSTHVHGIMKRELEDSKTDNMKLHSSLCKTKYSMYVICNLAVLLCERCYYNRKEDQKQQSWLQEMIRTILFFVILTGFAYLSF